MVEFYICCCVIRYLEKKCVVIFVVGIGNLYFFIDIIVVLCVVEVEVDVILMGKNNVDGVYFVDFKVNKDVVKYEYLMYI